MLTAKEEVPKKIQIAHSKMQIPTANQNAHSKTKSPQQNEKSTAKENHDPQHQDEAGQVAWLVLMLRVMILFCCGLFVLLWTFRFAVSVLVCCGYLHFAVSNLNFLWDFFFCCEHFILLWSIQIRCDLV